MSADPYRMHMPALANSQRVVPLVAPEPRRSAGASQANLAARRQLDALRSLPLGWGPDGDGQPLTVTAAELAEHILDTLSPAQIAAAAIIPNTDGGVQLEWGFRKREVEVVIEPDSNHYRVFIRGEPARLGFEGTLDDSDLRRLDQHVRWAARL